MNNEIPTIEVDMDVKCRKCGERGVTGNGLCLACSAKEMLNHSSGDIVLDCKIANVTTVWPKNQLKINLAATLEAAEYEATELGELAQLVLEDHGLREKLKRQQEKQLENYTLEKFEARLKGFLDKIIK